jgi:hypothetical protein
MIDRFAVIVLPCFLIVYNEREGKSISISKVPIRFLRILPLLSLLHLEPHGELLRAVCEVFKSVSERLHVETRKIKL